MYKINITYSILCLYCALIGNMEFQDQDFPAGHSYVESGPMTVSDLHHSVTNGSSSKKKREFKRQKAQRNNETTETSTGDLCQQEPTTQSTIEEPILNRLRSRLDPTYNANTAPPHTSMASDSLPESTIPAVDKPAERVKRRRKEKSRNSDNNGQRTGMNVITSETPLTNTTAAQVPVQEPGS